MDWFGVAVCIWLSFGLVMHGLIWNGQRNGTPKSPVTGELTRLLSDECSVYSKACFGWVWRGSVAIFRIVNVAH